MVQSIILGSSLGVFITMKIWTGDNQVLLFDALQKRQFIISQLQNPQGQIIQSIRKGTTTSFQVENQFRRIVIQITNELNSPEKNLNEVLDALSEIGFPSQESIESIHIQGGVTLKLQDAKATELFPPLIDSEFTKKIDKIFDRKIKPVGIRISSGEQWTSGASKSPFTLLIEPLFADDSNSQLITALAFLTSDYKQALDFTKNLYERLKNIVAATGE